MIEEALSHFVAKATFVLRQQRREALFVTVFLATSRHQKNPYFGSYTLALDEPSANTAKILPFAKQALCRIFYDHLEYKKVGVVLSELSDLKAHQGSLFTLPSSKKPLMELIDEVNQKFGKGKLFLLAEGNTKKWQPQKNNRSQNFTGDMQQFFTIHI